MIAYRGPILIAEPGTTLAHRPLSRRNYGATRNTDGGFVLPGDDKIRCQFLYRAAALEGALQPGQLEFEGFRQHIAREH